MRHPNRTYLLAVALCSAILSDAAVAAAYTCVDGDGSTVITSEPVGDKCEILVESAQGQASEGAQPPAAPDGPDRSAQFVTSATDDGKKDPREAYRDTMVQGAQRIEGVPAAALNPSVSRRYLMTDRDNYRKSIGADSVR